MFHNECVLKKKLFVNGFNDDIVTSLSMLLDVFDLLYLILTLGVISLTKLKWSICEDLRRLPSAV